MRVIHVLRKPLSEASVAANVLKQGCGALHIDVARISTGNRPKRVSENHNIPRGVYEGGASMQGGGRADGTTSLGRWPANLILEHKPGCRCVGTRCVPTGVAVNRNKDGTSPKGEGWRFAGQPGPDLTFGDGDGMETVAAWDCTPDCPVADLDAGGTHTREHATRDVHQETLHSSHVKFGHSKLRHQHDYGDGGGTPRFYFQVHEADE